MLSLLFFLISIDSLPPTPDLSQILFPEPHLWRQRLERNLALSVYGGHNLGGHCDLLYDDLTFSMHYDIRTDWDSLAFASGQASYNIPLSHLFLKPSIGGFFHERSDEYRFIAPQLDAIVQLPWSFLSTMASAELWQINKLNYQEYTTSLDIIFDRVIYMPHFVISSIYTGNKISPTITGKLHINRVHLSIGSLLSQGFPSPAFKIQYRRPNLKFGAKFMNGVLLKTLRQQFDPILPLQYRISIPTESLKTSFELDCNFEFNDQIVVWRASYNSWYEKISPDEGFVINTTQDVEELNLIFTLKNSIISNDMRLKNSLNIIYTRLDSTIAFIPRHALYDTLMITMGAIDISAAVMQFAPRPGVTHNLPALFIIDPGIGYHYKGFMIFFNIYNATDEKDEMFDGYFLKGRQYAIGFKFDHVF